MIKNEQHEINHTKIKDMVLGKGKIVKNTEVLKKKPLLVKKRIHKIIVE